MKLEQQVCSLDLAKRLKELGVKQGSWFFWNTRHIWLAYRKEITAPYNNDMVSAFTVAELGEMFPKEIQDENRKPFRFAVNRFAHIGWQVGYENSSGSWAFHLGINDHLFKQDATEADARAKMLIYLLENKLIPAPKE